MDSALEHAARALARFEPLAALQGVALREDTEALALRGIALAQLGEFQSSRRLLDRASKGFGSREPLQRARCLLASAEVLLALRDTKAALRRLETALDAFQVSRDRDNTVFTRLQLARLFLLTGKLDECERALKRADVTRAAPSRRALHAMLRADLALRRSRIGEARIAFREAYRAARSARILPLLAEIERAQQALDSPVATLSTNSQERTLTRAELCTRSDRNELLIDAARKRIQSGDAAVELRSRPVLFALLLTLAERFPAGAARGELITNAFGMKRGSDSLRARLRVELARLRRLLRPFASIEATDLGFRLRTEARVAVVKPLKSGPDDAVLALLVDGEAWPTSALATALGTSQRSVQRSLNALSARGAVRAFGRGRMQRWRLALASDSATSLLLLDAPHAR
jgi:tetratricopeptide (TPR) repeat protein